MSNTSRADSDAGFQLWWLPLAAGLLPLLAAAIAFQIAVAQGQFASCNPFIEGCVSISRAARHDLPNTLFRALMLPAATLQAMAWMLAATWLRRLGAPGERALRLLPWLGVIAAVFLVLYGTFLGTEGVAYRWMRRYGVIVYFGLTCIAILLAGGAVQRLAAQARVHRAPVRALLVLCAALPPLGLIHVLSPLFTTDAAARNALQNVTEWWGGLALTLFFLLLAWLWRATRFSAALHARAP